MYGKVWPTLSVLDYTGGGDSDEVVSMPSEAVLACMQQIREKAQELHVKWLATLR